METLTKQSIFDKVLAHSRQMTERCAFINKDNIPTYCMYRNSKGNKCFIGAIIPDDIYDKSFEHCNAQPVLLALSEHHNLEIDEEVFNSYNNNLNFVDALQEIHDNFFNEREQKLKEFAEIYNVNYTPLNQ